MQNYKELRINLKLLKQAVSVISNFRHKIDISD